MLCGASLLGAVAMFCPAPARAYPPSVGILGQARNCLTCHADNGPWKDDGNLIIDILDKPTGRSLKQEDGGFLIAARRGEARTVLTVIGTRRGGGVVPSHRNAWLYIAPDRISDPSSLSKFAPGWLVDLPMSCRLVGDLSAAHPEADVTVLPMTVRPGDDAREADLEFQVMLTRGEAVKRKAEEGMLGSYFKRTVHLKVLTDKAGT